MCLRPCSSPSLPISGMARNHETEADLSGQGLLPADAILIASDLKFMAVLTELGLGYNNIGDEGAKAIAEDLKSDTAVLTKFYLWGNNI